VGERLTEGAALVPVPVKLTVCGLPAALSEMLRVPLRVPVAVGVKVTVIVQSAPAATELPQLLVSAKSPALVPVTARLAILKMALPVLDRVTDCAVLGASRG
jgi:hypothetical protein